MKDYRIRFDCRLCGGQLKEVLDLGETTLANELPTEPCKQDTFPLYLAQCTSCDHVQLPVVVRPDRLFREYVYQSSTSPVFVRHLEKFAEDIQPKPGGFVVEIGSNDGTLLADYKRRGFEVLGIDPARNIADIAESRGVPTIRAFFGKETLANWNLMGRKADLIIALNVFAHADDLAGIADGVAALLADDGEFVFECGYLPDMIAKGVYSTIYHEHLSYHHIGPMRRFLRAHGLYLYDAQRVPTQGGSMRYRVSKLDGPGTDDLNWFQRAQEKPGATQPELLSGAIDKARSSLRAELDAYHAAGKTVCGYGSPAQLVTICSALGIRSADLKFVVDDNPLKVGRYTSGTQWPIVSTDRLQSADVCLIFSVNFASDIINRHSEFQGEWLLP